MDGLLLRRSLAHLQRWQVELGVVGEQLATAAGQHPRTSSVFAACVRSDSGLPSSGAPYPSGRTTVAHLASHPGCGCSTPVSTATGRPVSMGSAIVPSWGLVSLDTFSAGNGDEGGLRPAGAQPDFGHRGPVHPRQSPRATTLAAMTNRTGTAHLTMCHRCAIEPCSGTVVRRNDADVQASEQHKLG